MDIPKKSYVNLNGQRVPVTHCITCERKFTSKRPHFSKGQCASCYSKDHSARHMKYTHKNLSKGVYQNRWRKGPWMAQVMVNRKPVFLGSFPTEKEALEVRGRAVKKHYGAEAYELWKGRYAI